MTRVAAGRHVPTIWYSRTIATQTVANSVTRAVVADAVVVVVAAAAAAAAVVVGPTAL
jgi:hypothetical protein